MKKLFAALLAFLMVFTVMPAAFSAAATETPTENGQQPTDNAGVTLFGFADWKLTNGVAEPSKPYNFIGFNSEKSFCSSVKTEPWQQAFLCSRDYRNNDLCFCTHLHR